jgi:hypothetical protein
VILPWKRAARTTVGSAFVGTGQYNGLRVTSLRISSPVRAEVGDVGLSVVEPTVSAFDRFEAFRLILVFFLSVA